MEKSTYLAFIAWIIDKEVNYLHQVCNFYSPDKRIMETHSKNKPLFIFIAKP